jgi:hypothetical protein
MGKEKGVDGLDGGQGWALLVSSVRLLSLFSVPKSIKLHIIFGFGAFLGLFFHAWGQLQLEIQNNKRHAK